jgi:hypothetical protein
MHLGRLANNSLTFGPRNLTSNHHFFPWFSKTQSRILGAFSLVYLLVVLYCQSHVSRDPGSYFFTMEGYRPVYSRVRMQQVRAFLQETVENKASTLIRNSRHGQKSTPRLCIGMATAKRPEKQYVDASLASLFDHLSQEERNDIEMNLLIAHMEPRDHPSFHTNEQAAWVSQLADNVLTYYNTVHTSERLSALRHLERTHQYDEKSFYDYELLLRKCHDSNAENQHKEGNLNQWMYLRLFYTEEWPLHLAWSIVAVSLTAMAGLFLRRRFLSSPTSSPGLLLSSSASHPKQNPFSRSFIATISFVCVPAIVILYFAAGRMTVQPIQPGIHSMNRFGCCSQALVFPRQMSIN